jgi:hypothetical protein
MYIRICPFSADISLYTWRFKYYLEMALSYCLQGVPYFTVGLSRKKKTRLTFGLTGASSSSSYHPMVQTERYSDGSKINNNNMFGFQTTALKAMRVKGSRRGLVGHLRRAYEASYNENPTTVCPCGYHLPSKKDSRIYNGTQSRCQSRGIRP